MKISDKLRELNNEIAYRETAGDKGYFDALLHPAFRMRRASGAMVTRTEFIGLVQASSERRPKDARGIELDLTAAVMCVVATKQNDGSWRSFRNYRVFVRPEADAAWQLLSWANEPISPQVSIAGQVPLRFAGDEETLKKMQNLSAVYRDGDRLWVACDELTTLERLALDSDQQAESFAEHRSFPLGGLGVVLPDGNNEEIDVEGMDLANGFLWVVGSHSRTRDRLKPSDGFEESLSEFAELSCKTANVRPPAERIAVRSAFECRHVRGFTHPDFSH